MNIFVRFYSGDNPVTYSSDWEVSPGDAVVVMFNNYPEIGVVEGISAEVSDQAMEKVLRLANDADKEAFRRNEDKKEDLVVMAKEEIRRLGLEMKLVDARTSLDERQITFTFTADGRVDFRELVKILSKNLKKTIRMQQIGSRDEARRLGGYGICGKNLCCVSFKGNLPSITSDMARTQQIAHRGAERISGLCGRLMCCLAFEANQYKEMLSGVPELYSVVKTSEGKGTVMEVNAIAQEVKVKLENGKYITLKKEDIK